MTTRVVPHHPGLPAYTSFKTATATLLLPGTVLRPTRRSMDTRSLPVLRSYKPPKICSRTKTLGRVKKPLSSRRRPRALDHLRCPRTTLIMRTDGATRMVR